MSKKLRIGGASGFWGDSVIATPQLLNGNDLDFIVYDYLAEITMSIMARARAKDATKGYAVDFVSSVLKLNLRQIADQKVKILSNAGGVNPEACAEAIRELIKELKLDLKVSVVLGDDLMTEKNKFSELNIKEMYSNEDFPAEDKIASINAYLGAFPIAEALKSGADIVITGRSVDSAVTLGACIYAFGWNEKEYDKLAAGSLAGHIIECGCQATGGNYAFFKEVQSFDNVGYPIAEILEDGSFYITKHPGTGGLVSTGTVTAQLLYEISAPAYINPDVIAHFDTLKIEQETEDRVFVSGCRGSSPPKDHQVCINLAGGFRNGTELLLTGLDIEEKAKLFTETIFDSVGGKDQFDKVDIQLHRTDKENPESNEQAQAFLRIDVMSQNPDLVGRLFSAKIIELALANFPGWTGRSGVVPSGPYIEYWPALIDSKFIKEKVHFDGKTMEVIPTSQLDFEEVYYQKEPAEVKQITENPDTEIFFGDIFGTRSGDKGGCANLGVWSKNPEAYGFLFEYLTVDKLKELLPDLKSFEIDRFELPNILSLNFYIHGILQDGVSSSTRMDGQAKSLGEYLRAKKINVPKIILK